LLEELSGRERGEQLRNSIAGRVGHLIEPALEPLGFDWRIGVGILGAFAAREVFVSTMGMVFDINEADERNGPLREALRSARRRDGSLLITPLTGVALMVFFVLACQCMSTLAVVRRETGTWRWPAFLFAYQTAVAYAVTLLVYQGGLLLGWG
jgi:ferrous iron transport protein B